MRGLFLRRIYPEAAPAEFNITVTGSGSTTSGGALYLTMPDGTNVISSGTYTVAPGESIVAVIGFTNSAVTKQIIVNGEYVVNQSGTGEKSYTYTPAADATIELDRWNDSSQWRIIITED